MIATIAACLLSGCANDVASASDQAENADCSDIKSAAVPKDWSEFDEAVTCSLDGTQVAVYWGRDGGHGYQCLEDDQAKCDRAMRVFRERAPSD